MNLREKYYFLKDDVSRFKTSKKKIQEFEKTSNIKITEEHKAFLLDFPMGAYINGMFDNKFAFDNPIDIIYNIYQINRLFSEYLYEDAKEINLIPFSSSSGDMTCYIGGGEDNLGEVYFCENSDHGIESRILICKGFDTFMSAYKKTEGYDDKE